MSHFIGFYCLFYVWARAIYFQKMHSWIFFAQNEQIYGVKHSGYLPLPLDIRVQFEWPMLFLTFGIQNTVATRF